MKSMSVFKSWKKGAILVTDAGWGDSGKGKTVSALKAKIGARTIGGHNAGHTILTDKGEFGLGLIPSTIADPKAVSVIGQEVVINPVYLVEEIKKLQKAGIGVSSRNLMIDDRSHVVMPWHQIRDALSEEAKGKSAVGSLKYGVGWTYIDRIDRRGLRICDLLAKDWKERMDAEFERQSQIIKEMAERVKILSGKESEAVKELDYQKIVIETGEAVKFLKEYVGDTIGFVWKAIEKKEKILFEDAHGVILDVSLGSWPYTTGVNVGLAGVYRSFGGKAVKSVIKIIVCVKAYQTRVGGGPMPTENTDRYGKYLQEKGQEKGTRSGRTRRCGPIDLPLIRRGLEFLGADKDSEIALTKLDILDGLEDILVCIAYDFNGKKFSVSPRADAEFLSNVKPIYKHFKGWQTDITGIRNYKDLPKRAREYVIFLEGQLQRKITMIGVGKHKDAVIIR